MTLYTDALWCIGSIFFVGVALAIHTHAKGFFAYTLIIAFFSLAGIFAAFLLAFWIYTRVMGVSEMPMLNFLSLFILLGIGADDILCMTDTFRLVSAEDSHHDTSTSVRMRHTFEIAGSGRQSARLA